MNAHTATAPRLNVLGRYTTPHGGRKLCACVNDGQTVLTDEPVSGRGQVYPIDVVPASDGLDAVEAIVNLYLQEARASCSIPMARTIFDADLIRGAT